MKQMLPAPALASSRQRCALRVAVVWPCLAHRLSRAQKTFRRAVDRNLMRRRVRDVFRRNKAVWPERMDMVIVLLTGGALIAGSLLFAHPHLTRPLRQRWKRRTAS